MVCNETNYAINGIFSFSWEKFSSKSSKAKQSVTWTYITIMITVIFVMEKKLLILKPIIKMLTPQLTFV